MQKLVQGIHQFQESIFTSQRELFQRLVAGQAPLALFITCSDSRVNPQMLTQTEPGEIFIMRNAGNIVPAYGVHHGGEAATIEYAVAVLKVRDIILCGHSHCGAMNGLLHPETLVDLPSVASWLTHARSTARIIRENYQHLSDPKALLTATVEENVLCQLENLRTHPCVAAAVARGDLKLHAWVYKFETGQVFAFDAAKMEYLPVEVAETTGVANGNGRRVAPAAAVAAGKSLHA
jgi:carbonic anhydrase